jgi:amino acid adenylation domain-containing protein
MSNPIHLAAEVLGADPEVLAVRAKTSSFLALGGTSLDAIRLLALSESRLGLRLTLPLLLSELPFTEAAAMAVPAPTRLPRAPRRGGHDPREILPAQRAMLAADHFVGGPLMHLMSTAELTGPLDLDALREALSRLTARHEALRTVYARIDRQVVAYVLPRWQPRLISTTLRVAFGDDPVDVVQSQLARTTTQLLDVKRRPPVVFVLTALAGGHHLLSLVIHHVIADAWSIGLIWRELFEQYASVVAGEPAPERPVSTLDPAVREVDESVARRLRQLRGVPTVLELPSDLRRPDTPFDHRGARHRFGLSEDARCAVDALAERLRVTRTAVLLAAFVLVVGRRAGRTDVLLGTSVLTRPTVPLLDTVGPLNATVPLRCAIDDDATVAEHIRTTARALADGTAAADVPLARLVDGLGVEPDARRLPLIQVLFTAHDQFIPDGWEAAGVRVRIHDGHCGGAPADLHLAVQRWGETPRLALDYATAVLTAADVADLAEALEATLVDLRAGLDHPLSRVRAMSPRQAESLAALSRGPAPGPATDLWQAVRDRAAVSPDALAVIDGETTLTYADLVTAVDEQAARLAAAGVRDGDHVVVALPRSAAEIVAVAAVLRLGAAFTALHKDNPPVRLAAMLNRLRPVAALIQPDTADALRAALPSGCAVLAPGTGPAAALPAPEPDPDRVAYVAFTSGSTGEPKAVRIAHRGVLRLLDDRVLRLTPDDRCLRFVTLAFDPAVIEIFRPLVAGAAVVVCPEHVLAPADLATFLRGQQISVLRLTAGLFRVLADDVPEAFAGARHVLVGGDVVSADQVSRLLSRHPGLSVSNVYGPTENTIWTSVHTVTGAWEVDDALPIGRPVPGDTVFVLDPRGHQVPPGGIGELHVSGPGVRVGNLGEPPADSARYATGDLVRWDREGRLRFLGRADRQVKIRGIRIETEEIRRRLLAHPAVRDAVVVAVGADAANRRLLAAVVIRAAGPTAAELAGFTAERIPAYAVPTRWAILGEIPLNRNGKPDVAALENAALENAVG